MFFKNGGNLPLLITRCISCLNRAVIVVETFQLLQVQIMSGSRVPLSDHTSDPNPDIKEVGMIGQKDNKHPLSPRG